jgi:hypothetical protein
MLPDPSPKNQGESNEVFIMEATNSGTRYSGNLDIKQDRQMTCQSRDGYHVSDNNCYSNHNSIQRCNYNRQNAEASLKGGGAENGGSHL